MPSSYVEYNRKKIPLYSKEEIEKIRKAGLITYNTLEYIKPFIKSGVSTLYLNDLCHKFIEDNGGIPAPLNYNGFPKATCISVNHVICHGIPSEEKKLKETDIFNLDVTVILDGYYGDASNMYTLSKPSIKAQNLINVTYECLMRAIETVKPGVYLNQIGRIIEDIAHKHGFSVVEDFCGHGIGHTFHQEPQVLHYYTPNNNLQLEEGMVFTIEPMINAGTKKATILPDGWTAVTKDRSLSAQFEHTITVTSNGFDILTLPSKS